MAHISSSEYFKYQLLPPHIMPYLITTAGKYNGRSYILFMVSTGKPGKPGKPLESWKAGKLESWKAGKPERWKAGKPGKLES